MRKIAVALLACLALAGAATAQTPCEGASCDKKCTKDCVDI